MNKAKKQTKVVGRVAGVNPYLRLAVVTDFPRSVMRVQLADPEEPEENTVDWDISAPQTLQLHYRPWLALLEDFEHEKVAVGDRQFAVMRLPEVDLAVGLDIRQVKLLRLLTEDAAPTAKVVAEILALLPREAIYPQALRLGNFAPSAVRIGRDAILIVLGRSWEVV